MKGGQFDQLGIHQGPHARTKGTKEPIDPILNNNPRYSKMNPYILKEYFSSGFGSYTLLSCCQNNHLRKSIDNQKHTIVTMLGARKN